MSEFTFRHINRLEMPTKLILMVEDDIDNQIKFARYARSIFAPQGIVAVDFVSSSVQAAAIIGHIKVSLIVLDHDLPFGNGSDLIEWMNHVNAKIPIITASGIPENNDHMSGLCDKFGMECYKYQKIEVMDGKAYNVILGILSRTNENSTNK